MYKLSSLLSLFLIFSLSIETNAQNKASKKNVLVPYSGPSVKGVDTKTMDNKVMCGYQGWFNTPWDGADLGWVHWGRGAKQPFSPKYITVDYWPDLTEYNPKKLYPTGFKYEDGTTAKVFSSHDIETTQLHFEWMRDYGIDGAFVQRFSNASKNEKRRYHKDVVLYNAREAANKTGRAYAVMYDLSGTPTSKINSWLKDDWKMLTKKMKITEDEAYLHHNGKPLVAIWGIGFSGKLKDRQSVADSKKLISHFKKKGCAVMLGVPSGWLSQTRDATEDKDLHEVLKMADILSPWTPGRYKSIKEVDRHAKNFWKPDNEWCQGNELDYLPVIFPGFSWHNNKGGKLDQIPRLGGKFMWKQALEAKRTAGVNMIYIAMFDEVDEGTAIFKCSNNPPRGNGGIFLDYKGLPSDHYLKLSGNIGKMLRNEIPATEELPK